MILQDVNQGFPYYFLYMKTSITKHTEDHSGWRSFKFEFFCDSCNKKWISPVFPFEAGKVSHIEYEETRSMIWAWEHQRAFEQANLEAHYHFNRCPECYKWVCDNCFDAEGESHYGLCRKCSEKKKNLIKLAPGKLIITNFIGESGLTQNKYIAGHASDGATTLLFAANTSAPTETTVKGAKVIGNSVVLNVFKVKGYGAEPFTGNITMPVSNGKMSLALYEFASEISIGIPEDVYTYTAAITFKNGNATINFASEMEI